MTTELITTTVPAILSQMLCSFASIDVQDCDDDGPEFHEAQAACERVVLGQANTLTMSAAAWEMVIDDMMADLDKDGFDGTDAEMRKWKAQRRREAKAVEELAGAVGAN